MLDINDIHVISIHTPLAGSDRPLSHSSFRTRYFNPHSPCGERHVDAMPHSWVDIFQSTLPLRGATRVRGDGTTMLVISIHTPLAGSDELNVLHQPIKLQFQSTLPLRGAT